MNEKRLKKLYDNLVNDQDFDKLELGLNKPNIFEILKISKTEIRHSNFLYWLLNPRGSHGLGDVFLKRILREIFSSEKVIDIDQIEVNKLDLSEIQIRREWKNIDLLLIFDDIVICIENKIFSKEHSNQLKRYKEIVNSEFPNKRQSFVFLTPFGIPSENESDVYVFLSYQSIVDSLDRIINIYDDSIINSVKNYLIDYSTILKREIMGNDSLSKLSVRIYENHKEILDFIYDKKPDQYDNVRFLIMDLLKSNGFLIGSETKKYVRFTTPKIKELTYHNKSIKNNWKFGETFLFEFELRPNTNKISFRCVISPSDPEYNREELLKYLLEIDGTKKPSGKMWLCSYSSLHKLNFDSFNDLSEKKFKSKLERIINTVIPMVKVFEDKFLEHKDKLIKLKNWNEDGSVKE